MKRLLEIKKEIGNLSKNSQNPFFKSQYLNLTDLLNHVEPLLWEKGLILLQPVNENCVSSLIIDAEDNNVICKSCIPLPNINDPQKLGSAITYYRRYTLKSLLAIAEEDDDGNRASGKESKTTKPEFVVDSTAWVKAVNQSLPVDKIEQHFKISKEVEKLYIETISNGSK